MPRFFQYHPSIVEADAIGYSLQALHRLLQRMGHQSFLICEDSSRGGSVRQACGVSSMLMASWRHDDVLILHHSFKNDRLDALLDLPIRKILVYHNITPSHFFRDANMPAQAEESDAGRLQLVQARAAVEVAIGASEFSVNELRDVGYRECHVVPVFYDDAFFESPEIDWQSYFQLKKSADINIAFVGRLVPNKRPDKLIEMIAQYRKLFERSVCLHLVGKIWNEDYVAQLMTKAAQLGVLSAIRMHVAVPQMQVKTLLAAADAFVSFSEHEGFMTTLVEAFTVGCPVIAYRAAAIPETMGNAGIGVDQSDPALAAGLVEMLRRDKGVRREVIAGQSSRAMQFRSEVTGQQWIDILEHALGIQLRPDRYGGSFDGTAVQT